MLSECSLFALVADTNLLIRSSDSPILDSLSEQYSHFEHLFPLISNIIEFKTFSNFLTQPHN